MTPERIERREYLERLNLFRDRQLIKIITGVRRCGKSTLLEIYQDDLRAKGVGEDQILSINLEDFDYFSLRDPFALHAYVKAHLAPGKMTYVFIDEIQHCRDFPQAIDSLFLRRDVDLYLTGSNAYMLSGEIATLISGRYVEIKMLPLSFGEYILSTGSRDHLAEKYRNYLEGSSFPYALALKDQPRALRDYLEGIYSTIVVKDVALRNRIHDTMMLESVTRFVFDSIGSLLSPKKIADTMTSYGRKIDGKTVERYLSCLMESFVIYQAKRYHIRGKQLLKSLEKYYAVDPGLRSVLLGSSGMDTGHLLENVIYLELLRRGYEVYVGKMDDMEVDFVARGQDGIEYIQAAATVREESTLRRELAPLEKIPDQYPKILLTLDEDPDSDFDGIRRINALRWLVEAC